MSNINLPRPPNPPDISHNMPLQLSSPSPRQHTRPHKTVPVQSTSRRSLSSPCTSGSSSPVTFLSPTRSQLSTPRSSPVTVAQESGVISVTAMQPILNLIVTNLEELKADVKSLRKGVRRQGPAQAADGNTGTDPEALDVDTFPLKTLQEMHNFEEKLADATFQQKVVNT
ncbi:Uncharacterised protein g8543 [Pycnogonum litorale]